MKKVLVFIFTPTYGGPHNQVYRMYQGLLQKGYETILCVHAELDSKAIEKFETIGIKIIKFNFKRLRFNSFIKENYAYFLNFYKDVKVMQDIIAREDPDIVQVCGLLNVQAAAARRLGKKIVWQLLSTFSPQPLRFIYGRLVQRRANVIMSTGETVAYKHNLTRAAFKKVISFYPPVDTSFFSCNDKKRNEARVYFKIPSDALVIGTVGNRNRQKSHHQLVKIAKQVITKYSDREVYFVIVGSITPSYEQSYKKLVTDYVEENNLSDKIRFYESDIGVNILMCGFDIFMISSMAEGVPTALLEALSSGLPVVSTSVGSIKEIIAQNINGYTYEYKRNKDAVQYLSTLIENDRLRKKTGHRNRADAINKFDIINCINAHVSAYNAALKINCK